jgi:hypothetical protein
MNNKLKIILEVNETKKNVLGSQKWHVGKINTYPHGMIFTSKSGLAAMAPRAYEIMKSNKHDNDFNLRTIMVTPALNGSISARSCEPPSGNIPIQPPAFKQSLTAL